MEPGDSIVADEVALWRTGISPEFKAIREHLREGGITKNFLRRHDYERWSYVLGLLDGGSLLDIGISAGQFVYGAAATGRFDRIVGVDLRPHRELRRLDPSVELVWTTIADLPFDSGEFDTVCCMECLEHLGDATLVTGLSELRRVSRGRLIVTVPWEEHPLGRGHLQRFDAERIRSTFAGADVRLLHRKGGTVPWALIIE